MNKSLCWALLAHVVWITGCTTAQIENEAPVSRVAHSDGGGPRKLDVKAGSLRMRAPTLFAAIRPNQSTPTDQTRRRDDRSETAPTHLSSGTDDGAVYRLKKGDPVVVNLRGIPNALVVEDIIDENGFITLPYLNSVDAIGKTSSELEIFIHDLYVPDFYRYITVNVLIPTQRSYYVRGAVKAPGRFVFSAGMSLLQAITTAGGYTDFSNPKKVRILRGDNTSLYNMREIEKRPEMDVSIEPGDVIVVPEKIW